MSKNPEDIADEVLATQDKASEAIRILLDQKLGVPGKIPVFRTKMGETESYVASVTFSWIRAHVGFAHNLPLFSQKINPETKKIDIDQETIDLLMQRPLDWSRQGPMAQYLLARQNHKFPPILAALSDTWIDDPYSPNWANGISLESAAKFTPFDSAGRFGTLDIPESSQLFALDGQHRLLAISGALELVDDGTLSLWNKDRKRQVGVLTREELQDEYQLTASDLQKFRHESIGIEILPAVTVGETREGARRRIRTIFVHVNRLASPLGKSQMSALDEDNGFRIVARSIATTHPLFKPLVGADGTKLERVDFENSNLNSKSPELTTLETIANSAKGFLQSPAFTRWEPQIKGLVPLRPEEAELELGTTELNAFYDEFMELPSILQVRQGIEPRKMREFTDEDGAHNLLMRPVGQIVVAAAVGICHFERKIPLPAIFAKLNVFDSNGGFDSIDKRSSYWWGLLTTTEAQPRMRDAGRGLAINLLTYLLGGYDPAGYTTLTERVEKARRTSEDETVGFDGNVLAPGQPLVLPPLFTA
ncbi:DGQHR domain-containing protein [Mycobacterium neumannii]|uniref:DGQHR domain-containing protein n=1 Tax=Mycobacterium neumannii TaxID=2048551 RepID=UPI003AB7B355